MLSQRLGHGVIVALGPGRQLVGEPGKEVCLPVRVAARRAAIGPGARRRLSLAAAASLGLSLATSLGVSLAAASLTASLAVTRVAAPAATPLAARAHALLCATALTATRWRRPKPPPRRRLAAVGLAVGRAVSRAVGIAACLGGGACARVGVALDVHHACV